MGQTLYRATRILLAGIGVGAALLFLEAGARLVPLWSDADRLSAFDPHLGVAHRPRASGWWVNVEAPLEFRSYVTINAQGLRGAEVSFDKPEGEVRMLFVGDSMTEGLEVSYETTFAFQLERRFREAGKPVGVVNASHWGYGTDQELIYYRLKGRAYQPDVVVLFFFPGNDFNNNLRARISGIPKPYFRLDDGGALALHGYPASAPDPVPASSWIEHGKRWLYAHSKLYRYVGYLIKTRSPALRDLLDRLGLVDSNSGQESDPETNPPSPYRAVVSEEYERAWRLTQELLRSLRAEVEADGARFMLVILVDPRQLQSAPQEGSWDFSVWNRRLAGFCQEARLDCLDLLPMFAGLGAENGESLPFYPTDGHLTAAGHERVAEALWEEFQTRLAAWTR